MRVPPGRRVDEHSQGIVDRPILTTVIFLIIITLGIVSFSRLSIDLMPEIEYPSISVSTEYETSARRKSKK